MMVEGHLKADQFLNPLAALVRCTSLSAIS